MQERKDLVLEGFRTAGIQERRHSGVEGFGTRGIWDGRDTGSQKHKAPLLKSSVVITTYR